MVRTGHPKAARVGPRGLFVGLATLDVVHRVERLPGPDEKVTALRQDVAAGGPATNAAVAFAALGGRAVLLTALGPSVIARAIRDEVEGAGVRVVDVAPDLDAAPPVSSVMVTDATGERSVVGGDAADTRLDLIPDHVIKPHLAGVDVVLVDGHHPQLASVAARLAKTAGIPVVVDAGRWRPVMANVIPDATDVVASGDFRTPGVRSSAETSERLAQMGVPLVVTTAGPGPVTWISGEERGEIEVPEVRAVDTLGAGDVFHGAYAFAMATGSGLTDRIRFAGQVASERCRHAGPRAWLGAISEMGIPRD